MNLDGENVLLYDEFVEGRHGIWEARRAGLPQSEWTDNPILATRKFTNVFRILDRGSQYVLTDLVDPSLSPYDQLFVLFLYRHTGRIEAWEYLLAMLERLPTPDDLDDVREIWGEYRGKAIVRGARDVAGNYARPIFTGAYLVQPEVGPEFVGADRADTTLLRAERVFGELGDGVFLGLQKGVEEFVRHRGVGDFMAQQIMTDFGYTPAGGVDTENDFILPGPGARKGARLLAKGDPSVKVVEWCREYLRDLGMSIDGRRSPSLMDAQNTLCEFFKYHRFVTGKHPTGPSEYRPVSSPELPEPVLPKHWEENR